jgi:aspartyl-tRNA synthetase
MHRYRSHTCGALRPSDIGDTARLSGWCHRIRDHGGVLFIDLRDHYGLTQCVVDPDSAAFRLANEVRSEWVVVSMARSVSGRRGQPTPTCRQAKSSST